MTTIACDGRSMASDGMVTENDHICATDYPKVRRLSDGRIVGLSGNGYNWTTFGDWLDAGSKDSPPLTEDGFGCLVLHPDGTLVSYDRLGRVFPEEAPAAIGSGARFALAAMDFGRTAEEAIAYACKRDIYSGGSVTSFSIEAPVKAVA